MAYAYPIHDLRLIAITVFSAGVGVSLSVLVASVFILGRTLIFGFSACSLSLLSALALTGFDQKAAAAMLVPMLFSMILLAARSIQGNKRAQVYTAIIGLFIGANFAFHSDFLDVVFFYVMSLFLIGLLAEQAFTAARDERARRDAEQRASKLALALEQVQDTDQSINLSVKSLGRIETITADKIIQINSADGYANIVTVDGRELLHSQSLAELEKMLPNAFVRVHRSHLVNIRHVRSLMRNREGNGVLTLSNGAEVPVSRRIMPSIRSAISLPSG
ncbi:MAG: LytTR family DNA-binding domain-containing protein [Pseudomonadota bacterium]